MALSNRERGENFRARQSEKVARMKAALERAREQIMLGDFETGYCCCGSSVEGHGYGDGHSPVDDGQYAMMRTIEMIDAALGKAPTDGRGEG